MARLWLIGEWDLAAAPDLDAALRAVEAESRRVVVDLCRLTFMDSACLRTLMTAEACTRRAGVYLTVENPPRAVTKLLALTGAADRLRVVDHREVVA
ncbi:STAS domain-containing protein [Solirubrobacter taibaiensis]|nr:STAS domain-containing protein [Solirubrobacter taibaiensis]